MTIKGNVIRATLLILTIVLAVNAQTASSATPQEQVATVVNSSAKPPANAPVYTDYRGVSIGMTANEVRSKLDGLKKGDAQDFLVFSEPLRSTTTTRRR